MTVLQDEDFTDEYGGANSAATSGNVVNEAGLADATQNVTNADQAQANTNQAQANAADMDQEESALAQLDPIPEDTPQTGLLGFEGAVGSGFDAAMMALLTGQAGAEGAYTDAEMQAVQSLLNAYRGADQNLQSDYGSADQMLLNAYRGADRNIQDDYSAADAALLRGYRGADAMMSGYSQGGADAQRTQAALSGALGPEAQAQAMANFQSSPGQDYLREQTERGVLRNAAALGGLGGGNVMKELQRNASGLASQDFQNQFNRLGDVANRGLTADTTRAGMRNTMAGRMADLRASLGTQRADMRNVMGGRMADLRSQMGTQRADMRNLMGSRIADTQGQFGQLRGGVRERTGQSMADVGFQTGAMLGQNRQNVGDMIGANVAQTASAVAAQQGGELLANLLGGDASQLAGIIQASQAGDEQAMQQLAALLANISTGSASTITGRPALPGIQNTAADALSGAGDLAGGVGTAMAVSDPALKTDVIPIGSRNGHNLYSWRWNEEGQRLTGQSFGVGVMATEVLEKDPDAVSIKDGYLAVDYSRIF